MFNHKLVIAGSVFAVILSTAAYAEKKQAAEPAQPPYVVVTELNPKLDGKEVTMTFQVAETYQISGSVPRGSFPSFGITPVVKAGSPRFSVLVSGDLANLMERFGMVTPGDDEVKGRLIQATGKITVFQPTKEAADRRLSYQLAIRDWKHFRMLPVKK